MYIGKHKQTHRCRKQTSGYPRGEGSRKGHIRCTGLRDTNWYVQNRQVTRIYCMGDLQDGGGVRHGDHLLPHKYMKNTSTCGTAPTEHLLNAGRRLQTSKKARNSPYT